MCLSPNTSRFFCNTCRRCRSGYIHRILSVVLANCKPLVSVQMACSRDFEEQPANPAPAVKSFRAGVIC
jgi:hypothetical protein